MNGFLLLAIFFFMAGVDTLIFYGAREMYTNPAIQADKIVAAIVALFGVAINCLVAGLLLM